MLLQANGQPYEEGGGGFPEVRKEPPLFVTGRFKTVDECDIAATWAEFGRFRDPSWLIRQILKVPRVRGPFQTRMNALTGTDVQWLPGRDNKDGRRAAKAIVEDWPLIASPATRYQLSQWGLTLGAGFAQKHWYRSLSSLRSIPRLEVYDPQWAIWDSALDDRRGAYRIWTLDGWEIVPSPAQTVPGQKFVDSGLYAPADPRRWVAHEPYGKRSYEHGLIHALWASALGWTFADSDMSALCERQGLGGFLLKYPKTTDGKGADGKPSPTSSLSMVQNALRKLGRKFVIPVEVYPANSQLASYGVETFEWSGVGFDIVKGTKESKALDLGVLILGHNTTVSSTTAGASAGANVGNLIRGDIRIGDWLNEGATIREQVLGDWAEANFGDRGVAPIGVPIADSPMANLPAAQTMLTLAQAVAIYRQQGMPDDAIARLLTLFQVPIDEKGLSKLLAPPPPVTTQAASTIGASAWTDADRETLRAEIMAGNQAVIEALAAAQEPA